MQLMDVRIDPDDTVVLYELLKERTPDQSISHQKMPSEQEHRYFVKNHPYRSWWIIVSEGHSVGAIYATFNNEIGVGILSAYQRRGFASAAIDLMIRLIDPLPALPGQRAGHWLANINPQNEPSIRMFEKLGFKHIQNTYAKE